MRSVVLKPSERCPRCQQPPRWCVCAVAQPIATPLQVDVLVHRREAFRPSSTGNLIARTLRGARRFVWRTEGEPAASEVRLAGRDLWILNPVGEPMPTEIAPERVQVVLLDGAWTEASAMARSVRNWGRHVALPMAGASRYWLRAQQDGGRFSTAEALLFLLQAFGLDRAHEALRAQFELHVYASLRARGFLAKAAAFLETSPIRETFPDLLAQLHTRRPR